MHPYQSISATVHKPPQLDVIAKISRLLPPFQRRRERSRIADRRVARFRVQPKLKIWRVVAIGVDGHMGAKRYAVHKFTACISMPPTGPHSDGMKVET